MTTPRRILFAIVDGGGTVPADTSVIRALVERGHQVRVLADRVLEPDLAPTGAELVPWQAAPQRASLDPKAMVVSDWAAKSPMGAFAAARDGLMTGPAAKFARDVRAELQRNPADVVVANFFLFGAQVAAEAERVPIAMLASNLMSLPGWGSPPLGPGLPPAKGPLGRARDAAVGKVLDFTFDRGLGDLNEARRENGLAPIDGVLDSYSRCDRLIVLTSRAFEYEVYSPPANVRLTGPRLDDPAWTEPWTPPPGDAPLVLVGMSSTYMDHAAVLQRAADALGDLPVRGVLTTGPAIGLDEIDAPANVTVIRSAPHSQVLEHASAVITHGGHGTVIKTLAAGVPALVLPLGRDQLDNAARVAHYGAGLRLSPKAKAEKISAAVSRLLQEPGFREAAGRMASAIAADMAEDRTVIEIEQLAAAHHPEEVAAVVA